MVLVGCVIIRVLCGGVLGRSVRVVRWARVGHGGQIVRAVLIFIVVAAAFHSSVNNAVIFFGVAVEVKRCSFRFVEISIKVYVAIRCIIQQ